MSGLTDTDKLRLLGKSDFSAHVDGALIIIHGDELFAIADRLKTDAKRIAELEAKLNDWYDAEARIRFALKGLVHDHVYGEAIERAFVKDGYNPVTHRLETLERENARLRDQLRMIAAREPEARRAVNAGEHNTTFAIDLAGRARIALSGQPLSDDERRQLEFYEARNQE